MQANPNNNSLIGQNPKIKKSLKNSQQCYRSI